MTRTVIDNYLIVRVGLIGCFVENKEQENPTYAIFWGEMQTVERPQHFRIQFEYYLF